jgi:hypothetical protein
MSSSDLPDTSPEPKPTASAAPGGPTSEAAPTKPRPAAKPAAATGSSSLVSVTLDVSTGAVISVERVEPSGARQALSDEDAQRLAGAAHDTMESIVERAFEAGIACVLGQDVDEAEEADEDAPLTRLLLEPLIDHSIARRLMRREVLDRAALASLIRHARGPQAATTEH